MKMKKIYISPEIEIVECVPGSIMITASLEIGGDGEQSGEGDFEEGEATGAARGDWSSIWDGM